MASMSLRDAALRTARSVTTLRRYIRSGRLRAEKSYGRYGPEYLISEEALTEAGLRPEAAARLSTVEPVAVPTMLVPLQQALRESVPVSLYHELQMKHELLLVQYGMVRIAGLKVLELQGELDARRRQVDELGAEIGRVNERAARETSLLRKRLHEAELEGEARGLEIAALREKVRGLEMLTRNAPRSEGFERQFSEVLDQIRRVEHLRRPPEPLEPGPWTPPAKGEEPDH